MSVKVFELLGKSIEIDIDEIAKDLVKIDPQVHIGMGIFKFELMDSTEKKIKNKVKSNFTEVDNELFKLRINRFVSDCMHEVTVALLNN